jgi:hypothetical protein
MCEKDGNSIENSIEKVQQAVQDCKNQKQSGGNEDSNSKVLEHGYQDKTSNTGLDIS